MGPKGNVLDPRSKDVLASVVVAYIRSAMPVSSRQLTKAGNFSLSTASLRNAMADLEDLGFLTHPHVSAGRIPTDLGYRTFVNDLMTLTEPSAEEKKSISEKVDSEPGELDKFLHTASRILSRLTGEVAVVSVPDSNCFVLQSVHLTRVAEAKVLVVQVSNTGLVDTRLIETPEDYSLGELESISRRLTTDFAGKTLLEIQQLLVAGLMEEKVLFDEALRKALEIGQKAFFDPEAEPGGDVIVEGTENILEKPEFARDLESLRRMFRALDEKARLIRLLSDCLSQPGLSVVIGSENSFTGETHSSIIAAAYGTGSRVLGAIGVIGPRRMEYARIVPMVEEVSRVLTKRLKEEGS
jgi:heat-inducible transcriptional repressor